MAAASTTLMATALGMQAVSSATSSYASYQAMRTQAKFQKQQAESNARLAELQGRDAILRGEKEANAVMRKGEQISGEQKVALAANGIDLGSDLAADAQSETSAMSAIDQMTLRNNAWRAAWGYQVQANDYRGQGNFASLAAKNEGRATMLTGGLSALYYGAMAGAEYQKGFEDPNIAPAETKNYRKLDNGKVPDKGTMVAKNEKRRIEGEYASNRSKKNPLYADSYLNSSWWRTS